MDNRVQRIDIHPSGNPVMNKKIPGMDHPGIQNKSVWDNFNYLWTVNAINLSSPATYSLSVSAS